jgi:hypothetical protein
MRFRRGRVFAALGGLVLIGAAVPVPPEAPLPETKDEGAPFVTALDTNCDHAGPDGAGYQFVVTCPGKAWSPDRKWVIATKAGEESGAQLQDASGRMEDDLTALWDAMPFVVFWSPKSDWFFVNHYLGSGQDRLRVFEIVNRTAIERSSVFASATKVAISRYPCLAHHASVAASGWRWSRDGRRIAMVIYASPAACHAEGPPREWHPIGEWRSLWMIGDVETGRIEPASVRVRPGGVGPMPTDGPYARL